MKALILLLLLEIPFDKQLHTVSGMFSSAVGYEYVWERTKDRKKSVYSKDAMLERKIEIVEIIEL